MTEYQTKVNVPSVKSPQSAVKFWYEQTEIGSQEIQEIFDCSRTTVTQLKNRAREEMRLTGTPSFNSTKVNTECAFRSWGLDVKRLERGLNRPVLRLCAEG